MFCCILNIFYCECVFIVDVSFANKFNKILKCNKEKQSKNTDLNLFCTPNHHHTHKQLQSLHQLSCAAARHDRRSFHMHVAQHCHIKSN